MQSATIIAPPDNTPAAIRIVIAGNGCLELFGGDPTQITARYPCSVILGETFTDDAYVSYSTVETRRPGLFGCHQEMCPAARWSTSSSCRPQALHNQPARYSSAVRPVETRS